MATRRTRRAIVNTLKNLEGEANNLLENFEEKTRVELTGLIKLLSEKTKRYTEVSETLGEQIEDEEEFDKFADESFQEEVKYKQLINKLECKLAETKINTRRQEAPALEYKSVTLPKIQIKKFCGDHTEWKSFEQSFDEAVHKNKNISNVEKMNYLFSLLEGEAFQCVKGLNLSNENYPNARDLLSKRFGDKQSLISAHMDRLLNLETVRNEKNTKDLRKLYDAIEAQVRSLSALDCKSETFGPMLIPIIMKKLPAEFRLLVSRNIPEGIWDVNDVLKEFSKELSVREKIADEGDEENSSNEFEFSSQALYTSTKSEKRGQRESYSKDKNEKHLCVFCRRDHPSKNCDVITKPEARKSIVMKEKRCFLCLSSSHRANECKKSWKCFKCGGRHNFAICTFKKPDEDKKSESASANVSLSKVNAVLLQTAKAEISSMDGNRSAEVRILFDGGSQQTYICPKTRNLLKLKTEKKRTVNIKSFGNAKSENTLDQVNFAVHVKNGERLNVEALVSDICYPIENQAIEVAVEQYPPLQNLPLADSNISNSPLEINVLIGSKDYWRFIEKKQVKGSESGPVAIESKLGFILSGPFQITGNKNIENNVFSSHMMRVETKLTPEQTIKENFGEIHKAVPKTNVNNETVVEDFEKTTLYKNGRYEVNLPFKIENAWLGDNYTTCRSRLRNLLLKSFKCDDELFQKYNEIINDQHSSGVIEEVNNYENKRIHYLPHRPVVQDKKESTKVRIVFDASCKSFKGGESLNNVLFAGPTLTESLENVLLRFRSYNYVFTADIEKAFLQIGITPEHRDFIRFLWFKDTKNIDFENFDKNELVEYRFTRVLFGLNASPFLLQATLKKHVSESDNELKFKEKLMNSLHIDDMTAGANTLDEAKDFYLNCKETLNKGGFNLRKFKANSSELENQIYKNYPDDEMFSNEQKVLGMNWDKKNDSLFFDFAEIRNKLIATPTKRAVLQSMASIFDPLGLISPVLVSFKNLFQEICEEGLEWDEELPLHLATKWVKIINQFDEIEKLLIERPYCCESKNDEIHSVEGHAFSDASKTTYAAAFYLKFELSSGKSKVALISSKSHTISAKVRKSKNNTVPRNELQGLLLSTELSWSLQKALQKVYDIRNVTYWTDSSIACAWVQNDHKVQEKYIEDRLKKVREAVVDLENDLKLVASKDNPADIATREHSPLELARSQRWFEGPNFLLENREKWPNYKPGERFSEKEEEGSTRLTSTENVSDEMPLPPTILEQRGQIILTNTANPIIPGNCRKQIVKSPPVPTILDRGVSKIIDIERFSKLKKLFRVTAWTTRFKSKILKKIKDKKENIDKNKNNEKTNNETAWAEELTGEEINAARKLWVKDSQHGLLMNRNFSNLKHQLALFEDVDGLWRCGGRLENAELTFNQKNPYIIERKNKFTELVIRSSHENVMHNGVNETLSNIRQQYWIPKPRTVIKNILHQCVTCRRIEGKAYPYPREPQLPKERVAASHSFETAGIDYLGPVYVKDVFAKDNILHKAWIGLTTCATTRAIYLDLVSDCSSSKCINLLKRLTAVHGTPKVMISDNGTNFISADLQTFMANKGTTWKFNIEKAPWFGGFFERLVQSVKRCLRKVLTNARLTYEEMLTVVKQVQNIINNRPLTYVYTDENVEPLTPNKLLYGRNMEDSVTDNNVEQNGDDENLDERFKRLQTLLDHFWKRWSNEYLVSLRRSLRGKETTTPPSIGDVVVLHDDNLRRQAWRIGRITKLLPSKDGKIRACELICSSNRRTATLRRPITKLYPFEHSRSWETTNNGEPAITFMDDKDIVTFVVVAAGV